MDEDYSCSTADEEAFNELTEQLSQFNWKEGVVDRAKRLLYSPNVEDNIKAVSSLKAMLCIGREEVYEVAQEVIDIGAISRFAQFLRINNKSLQLPAAFCLTNVAAGLDSQTQAVVDAGAVDPLVDFLYSPDEQLRRQAIFCLANVGGSTPQCRLLLAHHPSFFPAMCQAGHLAKEHKILELVCWNLRNVCLLGGPEFRDVEPGIKFLLGVLKSCPREPQWSGSIRFALETASVACRDEMGRELMLKEDLMAIVLAILESSKTNVETVLHSAYEAIAWLLAFGGPAVREQLYEKALVLYNMIERALPGDQGALCQELTLKCMVTLVAADTGPEGTPRFCQFIEGSCGRYQVLLEMCASLFLSTSSYSSCFSSNNLEVPLGSGRLFVNPSCCATVREMAGFLFAKLVLMSTTMAKTGGTCNTDRGLGGGESPLFIIYPPVMAVLVAIVEFCAAQTAARQVQKVEMPIDNSGTGGAGGITTTVLSSSEDSPTATGVSGNNSTGPPIPHLSQMAMMTAIQAIAHQVEEGNKVHQGGISIDNPAVLLCKDQNTVQRMHDVLSSSPLSPECYGLAADLIKYLGS